MIGIKAAAAAADAADAAAVAAVADDDAAAAAAAAAAVVVHAAAAAACSGYCREREWKKSRRVGAECANARQFGRPCGRQDSALRSCCRIENAGECFL